MKLDPLGPNPDLVPVRLGGIVFRDTKHGVVVQTVPKKGKGKGTTLQKQYRMRFTFAARMAANPTDLEAITAIELSKGTQQVPRDVGTMAALGRYYTLETPEGTQLRHLMGPTIDSPFNYRAPAIKLDTKPLAWESVYLIADETTRLKLT